MKKTLKLLIVLIALFSWNVFAEGEGEGSTQAFSYQDFQYEISGFKLNLYQVNTDSEEVNLEVSQGESTFTTTTSKDTLDYIDHVSDLVIPITENGTLQPRYNYSEEQRILYVDLGKDFTKEELLEYLGDEVDDVSETRSYLAELVVVYRFTNYPSKYRYIYSYDLYRQLVGIGYLQELPTINFDNTYEQVVNRLLIAYDETTHGPIVTYKKEVSSEDIISLFNATVFSEDEYTNEEEKEKRYFIMFHDFDNIEVFMQGQSPEEQDPSPITGGDQVVHVEDTAASAWKLTYGVGAILFGIGIGLILRIVLMAKERKREEQ